MKREGQDFRGVVVGAGAEGAVPPQWMCGYAGEYRVPGRRLSEPNRNQDNPSISGEPILLVWKEPEDHPGGRRLITLGLLVIDVFFASLRWSSCSSS